MDIKFPKIDTSENNRLDANQSDQLKRLADQVRSDEKAEPVGMPIQDEIEKVKSAAEESPLFQALTGSESSDTKQVASDVRHADLPTALELNDFAENAGKLLNKIDLNKLENLTSVVKALVPILQGGALERLIGGAIGQHGTGASSTIGAIKDGAVVRDHAGELLGDAHGGFIGSDSGFVSEDPAKGEENTGTKVETPSVKDIIINFILGYATKESPVPMPPTPPDADTGKNMWDGVTFFKDILGISGGGGYENYLNKKGGVDTNGEPNPEGETSGGPRFITREMLKGLAARLGQLGEPNPESQAGSGGPIDQTKAGGNVGTAGEPVPDAQIDRVAITDRDIDAIRIRLESKFRRS